MEKTSGGTDIVFHPPVAYADDTTSDLKSPVGEWYAGETRCIFIPLNGTDASNQVFPTAIQNCTSLVIGVQGKGDSRDSSDKFMINHVNTTETTALTKKTAWINGADATAVWNLLGKGLVEEPVEE